MVSEETVQASAEHKAKIVFIILVQLNYVFIIITKRSGLKE